MKATEYSGQLFNKRGEVYTKFTIGHKVNPRVEKLIIALGGILIKTTVRAKYYEAKGDQIDLMMLF